MTLAAATPVNSYVGNGSANAFAFTFPTFAQGDLLVTVLSSGGTTTTLVIGTDYTVSGLNAAGTPATTGTVTLVSANQSWLSSGNLATGYTITIQRNNALAQNSSIRNQGDFLRSFLEDALDYVTMLIQDTYADTIVLPPGINPASFSPILPTNLLAGAGLVLMVNPQGTAFSLGGLTGVNVIAVPVAIINGGTNSATALVNGRVMKSNGGKIVESATTETELGYLSGVTSAIQTQIAARLPLAGGTMSGTINMGSQIITACAALTMNANAPGSTVAGTLYKDSIPGAYVCFNGTGTIAIKKGYNVTALTDRGVGQYTITINADFADANYAVLCGNPEAASSRPTVVLFGNSGDSKAAGSLRVEAWADLGATPPVLADLDDISVLMIGDLG